MRCGVRAVLRTLFCALGFGVVLWIIVLVLVGCFVSGLLYWFLGDALCFAGLRG